MRAARVAEQRLGALRADVDADDVVHGVAADQRAGFMQDLDRIERIGHLDRLVPVLERVVVRDDAAAT